ncbi:3'(2'),5'-bisphosphate nucleotidase CysQ family protein [Aquimarina brevivitae]|uniref:3'(2'), 5'-bisphosphate nucleotidase/myo-inositol-1(Or 4)-monophosphatase n=1 Tax=Aquimarina brevivitae TaxID=323412 RepID=A0A4Q7PI49_9FLAO|nr:inositol monophosphatase family protein [Aquimarina brevivitae]RZT00247.1 3'(2'), 5'-bisphosphate nucleotidase/myo-inositol-1(or 4)-monophosphatase [Aquimarina brevivitae]
MKLTELTAIAIQAARAAAQVIQQYSQEAITVQKKEGGANYASQVVTAADLASEKVILSHLLPSCKAYDIGLLSEETDDDGSRFTKDFFWCIDPMDGTLAFINGEPGYAVAIALVAKDGTPYIGVVLDPSTNTLYHAAKGKGAFKNQKPWKITRGNNHLTYVTDKKLTDTPGIATIEKYLERQVHQLGLSGFVEMSGAGAVLSAIRVLENGPACMLKLPKKQKGGGSIWDYAATACIYNELGLPATNFDGGQLDLNSTESTFMNTQGVFFGNLGERQKRY